MSGYIGNIPVPQATQTRQSFTATASQTTFNTAGYSPGYIDVFLNGVKLAPADYTATNGSDVVLAVGAASGDILETVAYEIFQVLDQDFTGDFTVDGSTFVVDSTNNSVGIGNSTPSNNHANANNLVVGNGTAGGIANYVGTGLGWYAFSRDNANNSDAFDGGISYDGSRNLMFHTNAGTERMRIDGSGNVGIGTSSPSQSWTGGTARTFQVQGPSSTITVLRVNEASDTYGDLQLISGASNEVALYNFNNGAMRFGTNGAERMRIDSSGNVGIGTTSPTANLDIKRTSGDNDDIIRIGTTDNYYLGISRSNTTGAFSFQGNQTGFNNIILAPTSGNVGIGTSSPSSKLDLQGTAAGDQMLEITHSGASQPWKFTSGESGVTNESLRISRGAAGEWMRFHAGLGTVFYDDGTERMRIDSSGNVGIGTASPSTPLHIKDSNGGLVQTIETGDSNAAYTKYINSTTGSGTFTDGLLVGIDTDESATFWQYEASHMKFGTSGTERMRIDSSGNLDLYADKNLSWLWQPNDYVRGQITVTSANNMTFTTAYGERMRIDGNGHCLLGKTSLGWTLDGTQIESGGEVLGVTSSLGGNNFFARKNNATGTMFAFWYNSTNIGNITSGTSSVSYNTSSDYRLKENVTDVTDGITRVKQLNPKRFNFIADPDTTVDGFIAHEAQAVVPEAVTGTHNEVDDDGNAVMQGIDQSKLVPLLTAALQEAIAKIETLETEMTSVKARLDALEAN